MFRYITEYYTILRYTSHLSDVRLQSSAGLLQRGSVQRHQQVLKVR